MAATNRYMNVGPVTWTPYTSFPPAVLGTPVTLTGVKSARYDEGISTKKEGADFDGFPTFSVCDYREPKMTLSTIDAMAIFATVAGAKGAVSVTYRDLYNQVAVSGGAKQLVLSNSQIEDRNIASEYRAFATQDVAFGAISVDGSTHPAAITAL